MPRGAAHLREVFYRMGFNDRDIVALSGTHTVGRCPPGALGLRRRMDTSPLKFV